MAKPHKKTDTPEPPPMPQVGDKVTIPIKITRNWADLKGAFQVTALGLPGQGNQQPISFNNG